MMPEMDGLTAIREIRETLGLHSLPIVSLTAKAMKGDREKALEAGAWDYVTKPVDAQRLLSVIHRWRLQRAGGTVAQA
jgi:CheY-like chemotaxis protein